MFNKIAAHNAAQELHDRMVYGLELNRMTSSVQTNLLKTAKSQGFDAEKGWWTRTGIQKLVTAGSGLALYLKDQKQEKDAERLTSWVKRWRKLLKGYENGS